MNEPNSTLQRLVRKLSLLDDVDEASSSGKLDLIVQLPYAVKTESQINKAEERKKRIEEQLKDSKYGIAYIDAAEHVTQLNRSLENNFMKQVEYLTNLLYSQLSITQTILDGTANEDTMNNYFNRTVEPIVRAIVEEIRRTFLTRTARDNNEDVLFFRDPFKLMPISKVPDVSDKLTRNEIVSSNEMRQVLGMRPSDDPAADELRNKNLNQSKNQEESPIPKKDKDESKEEE